MRRSWAILAAGAIAFGQMSLASARAQDTIHTADSGSPANGLPALPPPPRGVSTILGGAIRSVNPVLDEFSLLVYGERPMKILFDARTLVYRDGVRIPVLDLAPADHASVQTVLDGSNVFALSIHILSQLPEGVCQGVIASYNPSTGELSVNSSLTPEPVRLIVPSGTSIQRTGQKSFTSQGAGISDLVRGALVSVSFTSDSSGRAVASRITVLAVPGFNFIFAGAISYLDMPAGRLALVDSQDHKNYQISFDPSQFSVSTHLRLGDDVTVNATYNGAQYVATAISVN